MGLLINWRLGEQSSQRPQAKGLLEKKMPLRGSKLLLGLVRMEKNIFELAFARWDFWKSRLQF
jgi:hypothetical protein